MRPPEIGPGAIPGTRGPTGPARDPSGRTGEICGRLETGAGTPFTGPAATIAVQRFDAQGTVRTEGQTEASPDGTFRISGIPPCGAGWLKIRLPGKPDTLVDIIEVQAGKVTDLGAIRVEGKEEIVRVVVDDAGRPVPDASVVLSRNVQTGPRTTTQDRVAETTTDAQGKFVVPELQPGTYNVTIDKPGFVRLSLTGLVLPPKDAAREAKIELRRAP
ncbi:MAG: carboxypeptidase regulatory-like domain-containing protein [Planctomycetes bacterium]|nr:carboxypeptidase regulatory-like domain-containing protein [Planctomycetota bacterium]